MAPQLRRFGIAALAALPLASAHMYMKHPVPYDKTQLQQDRSPLTTGQYPCKFQTYSVTERTTLAVGQSYTLDFYPGNAQEIAEIGSTTGAAVHDGGSCQLSITTDKNPTAKSVFKVFHSIEGGCPGLNNQASTFQYKLPESIPNGDVTFAWTWFPVSSQNPEMYMNCAPVTVTGGSDDLSAFNELPDIFVANVGFNSFTDGLSAVTGLLADTVPQTELLSQGQFPRCLAEGEKILQFPNPGDSLDVGDTSSWPLAKPKGQCSSGNSGKAAGGSSPKPAASASSTSAAAEATYATTSIPGLALAESSAAAATTLLTTTAAAAAAPAAATTDAAPSPVAEASSAAAAVPSQAASGIPTVGEANGQCTDANDGQVICNGSSQYGLCNRGFVYWQDVAAGMVCQDGKVVGASKAKRHMHKHARRHGHN
ncbi:hypothetical protein MPH_10105 [Macrophomina phaseolina MS6]|uniref:Chitin-binding domain 3 n=1 Tax=Macrophomina phaseolina (strain MS6) TaxID=1126212 RepID=K2QS88_MACPH|nr:hypothetical protein MPH_10105 [Macrophomina phaseolina MS6]